MKKNNISKFKGRKEMFYLTTHSIHFMFHYILSDSWLRTTQTLREEQLCHPFMGYIQTFKNKYYLFLQFAFKIYILFYI